jgi:hypothetical protein
MSATATLSFKVEDFTGQRRMRARGVPAEATIGEVSASLMRQLALPANDLNGQPITYGVRANGSSLAESDRVGDVLQEGDTVTLTQNVTAG